MFGLGGKYGAVSFLQILSPELSDEMLADFLNTENGIVVNLHVQAIDQSDAIKTVKRLSLKSGQVWLLPENEAYSPIDGTYAQILGKVAAVVRRY